MLVRGVFVFSELAPAHLPLAHSIHASGLAKYFRLRDGIDPRTPAPGPFDSRLRLVNIFAYATELAPAHQPLSFAVTPPGGLDYVLRTIAMGPGGFCF